MKAEGLFDWKEVWCGCEGMVWRCVCVCVCGGGVNASYVPIFKIAPKVLVGKIFCLSLS